MARGLCLTLATRSACILKANVSTCFYPSTSAMQIVPISQRFRDVKTFVSTFPSERNGYWTSSRDIRIAIGVSLSKSSCRCIHHRASCMPSHFVKKSLDGKILDPSLGISERLIVLHSSLSAIRFQSLCHYQAFATCAENHEEYEVTSVSFDAEFPKFTETSSMRLYEDLAPVDLTSTMSTSYLSHDYKTNIEGFVSEEEEREICDIPSHPPSSSLVPYLLLMDDSLAKLNVLNAQLAVRKMRTLANPLNLRRIINLSYKPYNRFRALSESQCFPVHLTRTLNMRLIRISILKSIMKLHNRVK